MKFSLLTCGLLACLFTLVAAWTKEGMFLVGGPPKFPSRHRETNMMPLDQEIFRLRDELATSEGPDVTFYDFLGVKPKANQDDLNKAYKKKSRTLRPDK